MKDHVKKTADIAPNLILFSELLVWHMAALWLVRMPLLYQDIYQSIVQFN